MAVQAAELRFFWCSGAEAVEAEASGSSGQDQVREGCLAVQVEFRSQEGCLAVGGGDS